MVKIQQRGERFSRRADQRLKISVKAFFGAEDVWTFAHCRTVVGVSRRPFSQMTITCCVAVPHTGICIGRPWMVCIVW